MIVDLKEIYVKSITGEKEIIELDYKGLANFIFTKTQDVGELEMAREIYKNGELELDKESAVILKNYIGQVFKAVVHEALYPILDKIINQ